MSRPPLLFHIGYSPWSLKARLALGLAGIEHDRRPYLSVLGEPELRLRTRRLRGKLTVPVLITREGALTDSFSIARWALGTTPLWPDDDAVARWDVWSEELLGLGRVHTTKSVAGDPAALTSSLPPAARRLGPAARALGNAGARYLLRKYPVAAADLVDAMDDRLGQLAGALTNDHLIGGALTYADVTAAVGLSFIEAPRTLRLSPEARPHWRVPALAQKHEALLQWRDRTLSRCVEEAASR